MTRQALAVLGFGLFLALTGCGGSNGPALTSPGSHGVLEGAARVHQGDTVTIGSMFACQDKKGSVTITSIAPVHGTGMRVTGWAVRPNPFWKKPDPAPPVGGQIGVARTTLARLLFPTSKVIAAQCKNPARDGIGYEFAVQVQKTTNGRSRCLRLGGHLHLGRKDQERQIPHRGPALQREVRGRQGLQKPQGVRGAEAHSHPADRARFMPMSGRLRPHRRHPHAGERSE